jgi:hypothetical protein
MTYPSLTYLYPPYLSFYYLNLPQPNIFCLSFTLTELLLTCTVHNTTCAHLYLSLYLTEYILTWIYPTWISPTWIYPNRVFSTWICPTWSSPYPCKSLNKLSLPESIPYRFQFQFQSLLEMNSDPCLNVWSKATRLQGRPDTSVHWRKTAIITIFNCRTVQEIPNFYKFNAEYVPSPAGAWVNLYDVVSCNVCSIPGYVVSLSQLSTDVRVATRYVVYCSVRYSTHFPSWVLTFVLPPGINKD